MIPEDRILISCARQDFRAADVERVLETGRGQAIDWGLVLENAVGHGLAPLVCRNLEICRFERLRMPLAVVERLKKEVAACVSQKRERHSALIGVLRHLARCNIPVMLIKGFALDLSVYREPWYTTPADIDLIVRRDRAELSQPEYDSLWPMLRQYAFIECDWNTHNDITLNGILPIDFSSIWEDAAMLRFENMDVAVPCAEDSLIFSAVNSCRKKYFGLRSLCDLHEIVETHSNLSWDRVIQKARVYECTTIVYTALLVARDFVMADVPDHALSALSPGPIRSAVVRFLAARMCFCTLGTVHSGQIQLGGRSVGLAHLLPYASYSWRQVVKDIVRRVPSL